jgi:hypothetical protein
MLFSSLQFARDGWQMCLGLETTGKGSQAAENAQPLLSGTPP